MKIDKLYIDESKNTSIDKNYFYLGVISKVYRDMCILQVENLSWLSFRRIHKELLIPNTINYLVVIDSISGIFLGEVFQSKLPSSENVHNSLINENKANIFPELSIDIVGILDEEKDKFIPTGFKTVGLTDKVYIANEKVI